MVGDLISLFRERKVVSVILTGGEPLLRPDIADIVGMLSRASIRAILATNGTLLTDGLVRSLADNGLKQCQVSLDGHDEASHERIRGAGTFKKALDGLASLKKAGIRAILGHTLNSQNAAHALDVARLAAAAGADTLRYELFLPIRDGGDSGLNFNVADVVRLKKDLLGLRKKAGGLSIVLPCAINPAGGVSDASVGCGAGTTTCVINSDLSLSPCDLLCEKERTVRMRGPVEFAALWREDSVFGKWRDISVPDGVCAACSERKRCGFGCRAAALSYTGDFSARDPLCLLAGKGEQ